MTERWRQYPVYQHLPFPKPFLQLAQTSNEVVA